MKRCPTTWRKRLKKLDRHLDAEPDGRGGWNVVRRVPSSSKPELVMRHQKPELTGVEDRLREGDTWNRSWNDIVMKPLQANHDAKEREADRHSADIARDVAAHVKRATGQRVTFGWSPALDGRWPNMKKA